MKTHWVNPDKLWATLCGKTIGKITYGQALSANVLRTSRSECDITCRSCQQADAARQLRRMRREKREEASSREKVVDLFEALKQSLRGR